MIKWSHLSTDEQRTALARPAQKNSESLASQVTAIVENVANRGDTALLDYTRQFDCPAIAQLTLEKPALVELANRVSDEIKAAIKLAYENIYQFHYAQKPQDFSLETMAGVVCEQHHSPLDAVGLYIPGGSAPLPSTVLMLGIPAKVAGCRRKVLCTPPSKSGEIAPEIAYAAQLCEIDEIYLCGGAQAIAAMAFGTETIAKVDKIFGPGNSYVTEAKQQVSQRAGGAAIDMPAGPSEVLVLADANARPEFVASDLLSQAEHGADSQAVLISDSETLIIATRDAVEQQLAQLSRNQIASQAMENARYILADTMEQAVEISNAYAPEHLIVQTLNPRQYLPALKNAGSIFIGAWSPESAGDYASGTNHVLPTYGYARNYSSLGVQDFLRRYTVQELTRGGLKKLGPTIMALAAAEGLTAHHQAVALRMAALEEDNND